MPRHRHDRAYAAIVLEGGYEEAGDSGRFLVRPGDVLLHRRFEAHLDHFLGRGSSILNLPLPPRYRPASPLGRLADPETLFRLAKRDPTTAAQQLLSSVIPLPPQIRDWPDQLAHDIVADPSLSIGEWCRRHGLADATVSRGFRQVFGVPAIRFRADARARLAWSQIQESTTSLVEIALTGGFADQAHMTRAVSELTGWPAGAWRAPRQMDSRRR